ncbi:MAG: Uma2 family endonuclease [Blastocatellia bacterium]
MTAVITPILEDDLAINLDGVLDHISDGAFFEMCRQNPDMRLEMTKEGNVIFMPPTGGETSGHNFDLILDFGAWVRKDGTGKGFESNALFILPDGAKRSPDMSWIKLERWNALPPEERKSFPHICPDFVLELCSPTDSLKAVKTKMQEYIENGVQLGWLIDPQQKKVYIYQPDKEVIELDRPASLSGEPLLNGFTLDLTRYFA